MFTIVGIILLLNGCAKSAEEVGATSGDKSTLPVTVSALVEHAEYCKAIYDSGGNQKDEVAFLSAKKRWNINNCY